MEKTAYLTFYSILSLYDAYGTTKVKVDEAFLKSQKDLKFLHNLMRMQKLVLRFISRDCPPRTKKYLKKEIELWLQKYGAKLQIYYLSNEPRNIEIVQGEICLIQILQQNVFIPSNVEPKEWFDD